MTEHHAHVTANPVIVSIRQNNRGPGKCLFPKYYHGLIRGFSVYCSGQVTLLVHLHWCLVLWFNENALREIYFQRSNSPCLYW
jgi:hypothetical protein